LDHGPCADAGHESSVFLEAKDAERVIEYEQDTREGERHEQQHEVEYKHDLPKTGHLDAKTADAIRAGT
jgi:hypothetical protein